MMQGSEVWKAIPGFEEIYEISTLGQIRRVKPAKGTSAGYVLKPFPTKWGYFLICLRDMGRKEVIAVHRIMAKVFMGTEPEKHEVNHIDGDKENNRLNNLEYVTRSENLKHAYRLGLRESARRKLSDSQVRQARSMHKEGKTQAVIAAHFSVDPSTISYLIAGRTYRRVK